MEDTKFVGSTLINNLNDSRKEGAFALRQVVKLKESDESGTVLGVAFYDHLPPSYFVRYKAADGRQIERWWDEGALTAA